MIDNGGVLSNYSDANSDLPGIAITDVNLGGGTLYYSLDNGTSWSDVGTVSADSARVLYADGDTRLAFTPAADFHGSISDVVTLKAWDRTGGYANGEAGVPTRIPSLTGTLDTSGHAYGVTLSADGNTAYVADYNAGLQIINVSNPSTPTLTRTFDTSGQAVSVTLSADGNTAYVADGTSGLQIINVSNPSTPTLTGTLDTSGFAISVTLSADGNTAYVADRTSGLQIIDLLAKEFSIATDMVSITVNPANDAGSFSGDTSGSGAEDSSLTGILTFTDATDGASTPNYTVTAAASNGTASIDASTGAWTYAPNENFNGSDSFTVTVTDDDGHEETQVISLTVNPGADL